MDTGPLGILTNPRRPPETLAALRWAASQISADNRILVPSIADFEVRRELVRLGKTTGIASLDAWNSLPSNRYISLTDSALQLAAVLWAHARNSGNPTADPKELDCDVLIAAQALDYASTHDLSSSDIVIATVNVGHLSLFAPAKTWNEITP